MKFDSRILTYFVRKCRKMRKSRLGKEWKNVYN